MAKTDIFIGLWIPKELNSYLTLHTLNYGTTKSKIVRELITDWEAEIECKGSKIQVIVHNLSVKYQKKWNVKKMKLPATMHSKAFDLYVYELKASMVGKIEDIYISEITVKV